MTNSDEMDDAIDLAIRRTVGAQADVDAVIQTDGIPAEPLVRRVVSRAADLDELAREDPESGSDDDDTEESEAD